MSIKLHIFILYCNNLYYLPKCMFFLHIFVKVTCILYSFTLQDFNLIALHASNLPN